MKVAIIGSGISGLSAAYYLNKHAEISVFEKAGRIGGHTATVDVELDGRHYAIDTGFIVYNERTYPNFIRLMHENQVDTKVTSMGFSISAETNGLEYSGSGLNGLFAQRKNILSPAHWMMIRDILRFNKESQHDLSSGKINPDMLLGDYLKLNNYSKRFINYYLVPMGAAIWSASTHAMLAFPVQFFVKFFSNHGLLQVQNRPQWYVIEGGSRNYIPPLCNSFKDKIHLNCNITKIIRQDDGVIIHYLDQHNEEQKQHFDQIILACHSDEACELLGDNISSLEQETIAQIPYQDNHVVLHHDESLLPQNKTTWSSWNYKLYKEQQSQATLTYNMNILQGISAPETFCVTLNDTQQIDPSKILAEFNYAHPVFNQKVMEIQGRWQEVNGQKNTWYCGAYWRNGFHEDGVVSGIKAANGILNLMKKPLVNELTY